MVSMISTKFHYLNLLKISIIFFLIGMLTRSIARGPAAMLEYALIFLLLFISLIYLSENMEVKKKNTLYFLAFLLYFLVHAVVTIFLRSYELQMPLLDMLYYNFTEFSTQDKKADDVFSKLYKIPDNCDVFEKICKKSHDKNLKKFTVTYK